MASETSIEMSDIDLNEPTELTKTGSFKKKIKPLITPEDNEDDEIDETACEESNLSGIKNAPSPSPKDADAKQPITLKKVLTQEELEQEKELFEAVVNGDLVKVRQLYKEGADLSAINEQGNALVHYAVRAGHIDVVAFLLENKVDINVSNPTGTSALHLASFSGFNEIVEMMFYSGVHINHQDSSGNTALHFACQFNQPVMALMLINFGSRLDLKNSIGDIPLHGACRNGILPVVTQMCALGCPINNTNGHKETPLHLASRSGNCEVVRTLMLHGAKIDKVDKDGNKAADLAKDLDVMKLFAQYKLIINTGSGQNKKFELRKQLAPSDRPLSRLKIAVLGNSGVGKTTLIESLKCGFLKSFLWSSYYTFSKSSKTSRDATTMLNDPMGGFKLNNNNNLNYNYTKGVNIQKTTIGDVGEVMFFDFSGLESYYDQYSLFLGDSSCAHIIVLSLNDNEPVRSRQVDFWLEFIRARMAPKEPIGFAGCNMWAPNVFFVFTNPTENNCSKNEKGEWYLKTESDFLNPLLEKFERDIIINQPLFVLDAQLPSSNEMKELKKILAKLKSYIGNFLPTRMGCLEQTFLELPTYIQSQSTFPVVWFKEFANFVREKVNLFASDDNVRELLVQLQLMGEVICFGSEPQDMVVLNPNWLGTEVIGRLLSREFLQSCTVWSGFLQLPFLESIYQKMEVSKILNLLKSLDVSFDRTVNNSVEYYVHAYNKTDFKALSDDIIEAKKSAPLKCAIKIVTPFPIKNQFQYLISHVLVALHRVFKSDTSEFSQWINACRVFEAGKTAIIELENSPHSTGFVVHCYSSDEDSVKLFAFCETICAIVFSSVDQQCPGLFLQRLPASWSDTNVSETLTCNIPFYKAETILMNMFKHEKDSVKIDESSKEEKLSDILTFGSQETLDKLLIGTEAHISCLSYYARCQIAWLLDKDIELCQRLAEIMKVDEKSVPIEPGTVSIFDRLMSYWSYDPEITVRKFCEALEDIDCVKHIETVLKLTPIFVYAPILQPSPAQT